MTSEAEDLTMMMSEFFLIKADFRLLDSPLGRFIATLVTALSGSTEEPSSIVFSSLSLLLLSEIEHF